MTTIVTATTTADETAGPPASIPIETAIETDRYVVVKSTHGKGGFGKVSIQDDRWLNRRVAVKQLTLLKDAESRERFVREAKTLARMSHPNVPAIYDVKFSDSEMVIYFEFIEGETLRQIIVDGAYPSMEEARRWFVQVASALEQAHALGIIHRDVKPENIIVSPDRSSACLVDFGIALSAEDVKRITEKGYAIGTPGYMSPEQMEGREVDGAADLYSLAITLYETLSGHIPQPAHYAALSDANESVPPAVDDLIRECLQGDAARRIKHAKDFASRLRNAFRTDAPLSTLLTDARLHELYAALKTMSPEEFKNKPRGQKLLIINRVRDLTRIDKRELQRPTSEMIALLVQLCRYESAGNYGFLIKAAYEWGYEKIYGTVWRGQEEIREALITMAKQAEVDAHKILAEQFLQFVRDFGLDGKEGWYYHDVRINVMCLLANAHCDTAAESLAQVYDKVNEISH